MVTIGCLVAMWIFKRKLQEMGFLGDQKADAGDEGLGTYFNSLSLLDRKRWVAQETYWRKNSGLSTIGDDGLE